MAGRPRAVAPSFPLPNCAAVRNTYQGLLQRRCTSARCARLPWSPDARSNGWHCCNKLMQHAAQVAEANTVELTLSPATRLCTRGGRGGGCKSTWNGCAGYQGCVSETRFVPTASLAAAAPRLSHLVLGAPTR
jgi:hypothetical protein